jgi:hypothetical protein
MVLKLHEVTTPARNISVSGSGAGHYLGKEEKRELLTLRRARKIFFCAENPANVASMFP